MKLRMLLLLCLGFASLAAHAFAQATAPEVNQESALRVRVNKLEANLESPSSEVRKAAAIELCELADSTNAAHKAKIDKLLEQLGNHPDAAQTDQVQTELSDAHEEADLGRFQALFESPNRTLRLAGLKALGKFDDPSLRHLFLTAAQDPSRVIRYNAAGILGDHVDANIDALVALMRDEYEEVCKMAMRMLTESQNPKVVKALLTIAKSNESERAVPAIESLGDYKSKETCSFLINLIHSAKGDTEAACTALKTLTTFSDFPDAEREVKRVARDSRSGLQRTAVYYLDRFPGVETERLILELLASPDSKPRVQVELCRLAGSLGLEAALPTLAKLARSKDADVADAAKDALDQLSGSG